MENALGLISDSGTVSETASPPTWIYGLLPSKRDSWVFLPRKLLETISCPFLKAKDLATTASLGREGCAVHMRSWIILLGERLAGPDRVLSSILGLYPLRCLSYSEVLTTNNVSRHCQMSPGGQDCPQ